MTVKASNHRIVHYVITWLTILSLYAGIQTDDDEKLLPKMKEPTDSENVRDSSSSPAATDPPWSLRTMLLR